MFWGLLWAVEETVRTRLTGQPMPIRTALLLQMPLAVAWALLTPGIIWSVRKWPLEGRRWPAHLAIHLTASVIVLFGLCLFYQAVADWVGVIRPDAPPLLSRSLQLFTFWFLTDSLLYWGVIVIDYGIQQYARIRDRELKASQLETQLAEARLTALKAQLQPHFLFNALHTIGTLVRTGKSALAIRLVAGLGDLLRTMLTDAATQEVPLRRELAFLASYLEIERIRFSDRLEVVFQVDEATLDASVPHLILQPLVENAMRHGIAPQARGGRLIISARRMNGQLMLSVRDDGRGLSNGNGSRGARRLGVGLNNIRDRLEHLFGPASSITVEAVPSGGVEARILIPYRVTGGGTGGTGATG
jgi:hypothetical protein